MDWKKIGSTVLQITLDIVYTLCYADPKNGGMGTHSGGQSWRYGVSRHPARKMDLA